MLSNFVGKNFHNNPDLRDRKFAILEKLKKETENCVGKPQDDFLDKNYFEILDDLQRLKTGTSRLRAAWVFSKLRGKNDFIFNSGDARHFRLSIYVSLGVSTFLSLINSNTIYMPTKFDFIEFISHHKVSRSSIRAHLGDMEHLEQLCFMGPGEGDKRSSRAKLLFLSGSARKEMLVNTIIEESVYLANIKKFDKKNYDLNSVYFVNNLKFDKKLLSIADEYMSNI
jgi:hypothetical protein